MSSLYNKLQASSFKLQAKAFGFLLMAFSLLLSGCGFHLRGSEATKLQLPPIVIAGKPSAIQNDLRRVLEKAGMPVVETAAENGLVLKILSEDSTRRVLSVGSTGKVEEYELYYAVGFAVEDTHGAVLLPPQTVSQTRSYGFSETDVLAKDAEQMALMSEMRRETAQQILRRLRSLAR